MAKEEIKNKEEKEKNKTEEKIEKTLVNSDLEEKKKKIDEKKKEAKKEEILKKTEAVINAQNVPISTKHSIAICAFLKNKRISKAISELEEVLVLRRAIPMKGEIPHRKGKMMSGRFPKKAASNFLKLLKSLNANANYNKLEDPIIIEAIANIGARPYGKFGRVRKKRTHIKIIAKDKQKINSNKTK